MISAILATKASGLGALDDFRVPRSLSATATPIHVRGGGLLREGSTVSNVEIIARGRGIREVKPLVDEYGGRAGQWRKLKGVGEVEFTDGAVRKAELHWYQNDSIGKVEWKPKTWLD